MKPDVVLRGLAALATDRTPLRDLAELSGDAGADRWSEVTLQGSRHHAHGVATPGRVQWRVYAMPGSRLRTWCAAATDAAAGPGPIRFTLDARTDRAQCDASLAVNAGSGWRELRLELPAAFVGEITIALVVETPAGAPAVALWGDPMLERRRPIAEIARAGVAALRLIGLRGVMQRAAAAASRQEDTERYRHWLAAHAPSPSDAARLAGEAAQLRSRALVSVMTPVFNTDPAWLRRCIDSVRRQSYPHWELLLSDDGSTDRRTLAVLDAVSADPRVRVVRSAANGGIVRASNAALAAASGPFVGFLDHDDELAPNALAEVIRRVEAQPDVDVVYTDEDKIDPSGARSQPHFKPDWSPELLFSCMYTSHFTVMRRRVVVDAGGFRDGYDGAQDYDLMLRVIERTDRIAHVPQVLYSWRTTPLSAASSQLAKPWAIRAARRALEDALHRKGVAAAVVPAAAAGHFRVRHVITGAPLVSILILSTGRAASDDGREGHPLARLVRAIVKTTPGRAVEIVVGHEAPLRADAAAALGPLRHRTIPVERDSRPAARLNQLARHAGGDHLLVLDEDVQPFEPGWLDAMVEFSQQDAIGAVGGLLLRRDGTIEHAGIVIGAGGLAACAFRGEPAWTRGHLANTLDVRNCSAVSGGCLLTRRAIFETLGGFDERFGRGLFEIDYGLRMHDAGLRVVVTPHARVRAGSACGALEAVSPDEAARLRDRWGARLDADPYYNPNFDRRSAGYRLPPARD